MRLTEQELEQAINDYGGKITSPPNNNFNDINIYDTRDPNEVNIDYDLWTDNKKSDLTISVNLKQINDHVRFSVESIHVL
jgi:protein tyrosine/serine phosphatase